MNKILSKRFTHVLLPLILICIFIAAGRLNNSYAAEAITSADVVISPSESVYTGKSIMPSVSVKIGSRTLKAGTDYTLYCYNNVRIGKASVLIIGRGKYNKTLTRHFYIKKEKPKPKKKAQIIKCISAYHFSEQGKIKVIKAKTNSNLKLRYTSSNKKVAKVSSSGKVTALRPGKAIITIMQPGNKAWLPGSKKVVIAVPKVRDRYSALRPLWDTIKKQQKYSWNARYSWTKPTIRNSKYQGTCITMPAVSFQRLGLIKPYNYITSAGTTGKSEMEEHIGVSIRALKSVNGRYFSWFRPNISTKEGVKKGKIITGDLVNYIFHTQFYVKKDKSGRLLYHSSGHTGSGVWHNNAGSNRTGMNKRTWYDKEKVFFVARINTFMVRTSSTNGSVTGSNLHMAGRTVKIKYKPSKGYKINTVLVDGKKVSIRKHPKSYIFKKLDQNHRIYVSFTKI